MIGALFRLIFRGVALLLLLAGAFVVYHLYQSGRLPRVEKALTETALRSSIHAALAIHRDLSRRELEVAVDGSTVELRGLVASEAEKIAASELAENVDGVERVVNDLEVEPSLAERDDDDAEDAKTLGERLDDVALLAKVRAALHLDREARKLDIDVSVSSGTVTLSGTVPSDAAYTQVVSRVENVSGVVAVSASELRVAGSER